MNLDYPSTVKREKNAGKGIGSADPPLISKADAHTSGAIGVIVGTHQNQLSRKNDRVSD